MSFVRIAFVNVLLWIMEMKERVGRVLDAFRNRSGAHSYNGKKMETEVTYEELADAWVKIEETIRSEEQSEDWKMTWVNRVFCELLVQCGWTVKEWNAEVARRKAPSDAGDPER